MTGANVRMADPGNDGGMWLDQGSKARRPREHMVLTHRPRDLAPLRREGIAMKATRRPLAGAARPATQPREHAGAVI